jgi:2-polyprenyl-6-methoxyphenol hydroxylase-like FAD-dependent oxidoreductase
MRPFDTVVIGGGFAGSLAAAMLSRRGFSVATVDPHAVYPVDFRCEKLDGSQVATLEKTGLSRAVLSAATPFDQLWIARYGRLVEKRRNDQFGIAYESMVAKIRDEIPSDVEAVIGRAQSIETSDALQTVTLSGGRTISARLVILATGLNNRLREGLGMERCDVVPAHTTTIGFDVVPVGRPRFDFPSLTYYPESSADDVAYLTLFPIGQRVRANLFTYRRPGDPWLETMRINPRDGLLELMPHLSRFLGEFEIAGRGLVRPVDLFKTTGHNRPGVVLVGDAFGTSCPAAGTGANKVLTDVERLCNQHVPNWMATPGMAAGKIAEFYADPVKQAVDEASLARAERVRVATTSRTPAWRARRAAIFVGQFGRGLLGLSPDTTGIAVERPSAP